MTNHADDNIDKHPCINCERPRYKGSMFHCPACTKEMPNQMQTSQKLRWFGAGGKTHGPRFGEAWPPGFPEHRSLPAKGP